MLKFVDKIIQKLLSLAFDAIVGFQKMLTTGIDIPVISWIWKQISGHSLTMLDLFSLGLGVPATLLYKLTFGLPDAKAPFTDDQAQQIVATLNNPQTFPWPILGSSLAAVSTSPFTPAAASSPFTPEVILTLHKVLIAPGSLAFCLTNGFNDFVGWSNVNESGLMKQTAPYAAGSKIIGGVLLRFALIPTAVLKGIPISTKVDLLTLLNWSVGFSPFIALLALALRPSSIPGFGMAVASAIGFFQFGVAFATVVEQASLGSKVPYTVARNLIAPLPNMAKPILMIPGEPEAGIALAAVLTVDAICDLGVGALALCADLL